MDNPKNRMILKIKYADADCGGIRQLGFALYGRQTNRRPQLFLPRDSVSGSVFGF